jgi:hypothetical protein
VAGIGADQPRRFFRLGRTGSAALFFSHRPCPAAARRRTADNPFSCIAT